MSDQATAPLIVTVDPSGAVQGLRVATEAFDKYSSSAKVSIKDIEVQFNMLSNNGPKSIASMFSKMSGYFNSFLSGVKSILSSLLDVVTSVFARIAAALSVSELMNAQIAMQKFEVTLSMVTGSSSAAKKELEWLMYTSNRLGISFEDSVGPFAKFAAAIRGAIPSDKIRETFTAFAEASAALHLSGNEVQGVFLALQQIASKGVVSMEELRLQLAERLPGAMQLAAKAWGMSYAEFEQAVQKRLVPAGEFIVKYSKAVHDEFGTAASKAAEMTQAALNRFSNAWLNAKAEFMSGGFGDAIVASLSGITSWMNANRDTIQEFGIRVGNAMKNAFNWVKEMANNGGFESAFAGVKDFLSQMVEIAIVSASTILEAFQYVLTTFRSLSASFGLAMEAYYKVRSLGKKGELLEQELLPDWGMSETQMTAKRARIAQYKADLAEMKAGEAVGAAMWSDNISKLSKDTPDFEKMMRDAKAKIESVFTVKPKFEQPTFESGPEPGAPEPYNTQDLLETLEQNRLSYEKVLNASERSEKDLLRGRIEDLKLDIVAMQLQAQTGIAAGSQEGAPDEQQRIMNMNTAYQALTKQITELGKEQKKYDKIIEDSVKKSETMKKHILDQFLTDEQKSAKKLMDLKETVYALRAKPEDEGGINTSTMNEWIDKLDRSDYDTMKEKVLTQIQGKTEKDTNKLIEYGAIIQKLRDIGETAGGISAETAEKWQKRLENSLNGMSKFAEKAAESMQKAFADFLFDPFKDGLEGMLIGFGNTVKRMVAEMVSAQIMKDLFGSFGQKGNTEIGGLVGTGLSYLGTLFSANGNAFGHTGLIPFADGGILSSPTMFPIAGGRTGVAGEAGEEGILPLKRNKDGKLGVTTDGASNRAINITVNVSNGTPDNVRRAAASGARSALSALSSAQRFA